VAYMEQMQRKGLEETFFAFRSCKLDVNAGLSWYAKEEDENSFACLSVLMNISRIS
jgi:hypothetical protein